MKYYFLFGEEPCIQLDNDEKITYFDEGGVYEWDSTLDSPYDLLDEFSEWGHYAGIDKKLYTKLLKKFN